MPQANIKPEQMHYIELIGESIDSDDIDVIVSLIIDEHSRGVKVLAAASVPTVPTVPPQSASADFTFSESIEL